MIMTQEEFDKAPLLDQILYDTTGMLVENHPCIADAMDKYHQAKLKLLGIANVNTSTFRITLPLEMIWQPKEDITTYELAMCVPYFFRHHGVMPYEVDKSLPHFRHFKIIDHNVQ